MRDILEAVQEWYGKFVCFALATAVQAWKSGPRQAGAPLAVRETGEVVGSVSGGCVLGAVYGLAEQVLKTEGPVLQRCGVSDDDAPSVGLTCRGVLDVFVEPVDGSDAELPGQQVRRLAHRVVWANPRKAAPGFAPVAAGMAAALPHVDDLMEGHSVAALDHLAAVLGAARAEPKVLARA